MTNIQSALDRLRAHRSILLGCEAIGWLHMAGKAHPNFLRKNGWEKNGYDLKGWATALKPDLKSVLDWLASTSAICWPDPISTFFAKFDDRDARDMLGLLQAAHGMTSGIEKNHHPRSTTYLSQTSDQMWQTTSFGHPVRNLLEDQSNVLLDGSWDALLSNIGTLLNDLDVLGRNNAGASVADWHSWREHVIGSTGWLRQAFTQTLAETRVPNNDVTLWDQSYVTAALFKSAAAGVLLQGDSFVWDANLKQNTRWRILTIGLGAIHCEARAVRIGDWTGARRQNDQVFDDICMFIEVELALGSLLYRDSAVLVFSFPGQPIGTDDTKEERKRWCQAVQCRIDKLAMALDTPPVVRLSGSTRSMILMAGEIEEARKTLRVPIHRSWSIPANNEAVGGHTCPVCGLRANGSSKSTRAKKGAPCGLCRERRNGRLQDWLAGRVEGDTIWISEVADHHDRVALLTLNLDLSNWLDGSAIDSLRAQSVKEWSDKKPSTERSDKNSSTERSEKDPSTSISLPATGKDLSTWLRKAMGGSNDAGKIRSLIKKKLASGLKDQDWESFFNLMVHDRSDAPSWEDLDGHDNLRADWLAHQLFRKNASPGRVRRLWETTEAFFSESLVEIRKIVNMGTNPWRVRRLVILPMNGNWTERQTYAGHFGGGDRAAPLEFVYSDARELITICNLARILGHTADSDTLKGKTLDLIDDDGTRHTLTIEEVLEAPSLLNTYHPLVVLDRSPTRFRLLVPLKDVDACMQSVVKKWEAEFARVWDRLPLRVGVVGFPRKLPYQAVVEAARNVEEALTDAEPETWKVENNTEVNGNHHLLVSRSDGEQQRVTIPTALPNGDSDVFYPNCAVKDETTRYTHDFSVPRRDPTNNRSQQVYRWVPELCEGDRIHVAPAQFAQMFLDSTARRFSQVSVRHLDDCREMQETWQLVRQVAPSLTAARTLEAILLEKQEVWAFPDTADSGAWLDFVRASLVNLWSVSGARLNTLMDAARRGILLETMAWHLHVLKQDTEI